MAAQWNAHSTYVFL